MRLRSSGSRETLTRFSVAGAVMAVALITWPSAAWACSCVPPETREAAAAQLSRYDVAFEGTVVRTFPGTVVYAVAQVYSGEVSDRVLISAASGGTSCDSGPPPRGTSHFFVGTSQTGILRAAEGAMCLGMTQVMDGSSVSLKELATDAYGPPRPPTTTLGSRVLTLAELPLTWLVDRRVLLGIAIVAVVVYIVHYYRSRYGSPR